MQNLKFVFKNFSKAEMYKSTQQGAATTVLCAVTDNLQNGAYYADCAVKEPHTVANDPADAAALYDYCEELTKKFQE